ncbi:Ribosomal RNA large subunit methyltransferase E [Burkholderiales bacterium]|nr:Ribosomal RNA large subunit methyltransferase E [Burkholderiales bacterium]
MAVGRHKSNKGWMHEHVNDHWVQEAQRLGYRSRAAFKLLEIDGKDHLFKPGMSVVDLGATPGSWSQVAVQKVGTRGRVIALDLLEMAPLPGVCFIQGDFREDAIAKALEDALAGRRVDLVLSDLAPNISGVASADQARSVHLVELAAAFAAQWLAPDGRFLAKAFQGEGFEALVKELRQQFKTLHIRKPKASRDRSPEVYLLAAGPRGS